MIGGLQGENGDLDIKYLKQNIKKCWSQISGSTQENFADAQNGCEISQTYKMTAKLAFSLVWSASNDSKFFISTLIYKPFEALDYWLPELQNDIYYTSNGLQEMLQKCQTADVLLDSSC